eukprot:TRINITY_DN13758_c0_g2_i1.p1 TRINITY_DN13758_c0_g2~~TRINITY_DN13758_c0_g2_i1.p1  ORF type:complete len:242 (+),score=41.19 TRINITY_DN13758_c0_g2_i1:69-728(+)
MASSANAAAATKLAVRTLRAWLPTSASLHRRSGFACGFALVSSAPAPRCAGGRPSAGAAQILPRGPSFCRAAGSVAAADGAGTSAGEDGLPGVGEVSSAPSTSQSPRRTESEQPSATAYGGQAWPSEDGHLQRSRLRTHACPFTVHRTGSDKLPVYVYKRKNRNEVVTVVRKVRGSEEDLRRELEFLCRCRVSVGRSGFLEVPGHHKRAIKAYLRSIGY